MLIFTHSISSRLEYIAGFIAAEAGVSKFQLTSDIIAFQQYHGVKINYSNERIGQDEIWIRPHSLLFEKNIRVQEIKCFELNGTKGFFRTEGDWPFDIFAASFYLLSRYEEYLPHQKDMYGRYAHTNSLAFRENFLTIPIVSIWLTELREALIKKFPQFPIPNSQFRFMPTYDIDEAYAYKYKSWWRTAGATARAIIKGQWSLLPARKAVLQGKQKDPYDSFQEMDKLHEMYDMKPVYFFLAAHHTGKFDKNILPGTAAMRVLFHQHAEKYSIGVHPSWQSGDDPSLIKKEIKTIEESAGITITSSRQHYIRFTLPQTFGHLIDAGIRQDFSMGYGSINGFRASVASPFYWYDLSKEKATELLLYPFCFMEANSFYEQKQSPQEALAEMRHYYSEVKKVNGTLITLWHNTFLGTDPFFAGWKEIYKQFVKEIYTPL